MDDSKNEQRTTLIERIFEYEEIIGRIPAFFLAGFTSVVFLIITLLPYTWATTYVKIILIITFSGIIYGTIFILTFYKDFNENKKLKAEAEISFNTPRLFEVNSEKWDFELREDGSTKISRTIQIRNIHKDIQESLPIIHLYDLYDFDNTQFYSLKNLVVKVDNEIIQHPNLIRQHSTNIYSGKSKKRIDKKELCKENKITKIIANDIIDIPIKLQPNKSAFISIDFEQNGIFINLEKEEWAGAVNQFLSSKVLEFTIRPPEGYDLLLKDPNPRYSIEILDRVIGHKIDSDILENKNLPTNNGKIRWYIDFPKFNCLYKVYFKTKKKPPS
jgi:hypothetical protein